MTSNPDVQAIIQECIALMHSWEPKWDEEDIFYSACGSVLKYAEEHGLDGANNPELLATIQAAVRQAMKQ